LENDHSELDSKLGKESGLGTLASKIIVTLFELNIERFSGAIIDTLMGSVPSGIGK
jgi:hypothetical protein